MRDDAMHILFATSEATPWSKTGGLADVCSALPKALDRLGRHVTIVTPYYRCVRNWFLSHEGKEPEALYGVTLGVPIAREVRKAGVRKTTMPGTNVVVYFIEHNDYFDRDGIYNYQGVDFKDNCDRYAFFSRIVLELIARLEPDVDVVHVNDWQTALVPVYLDSLYRSCSRFDGGSLFGGSVRPRLSVAGSGVSSSTFDRIRTVLTIHNLRHQGRFWRGAMDRIGLDWSLFTFDKMEFYGQLNLLKSGVVFADAITTVSPRYAEEIQTEAFGEKLQGVLSGRSSDLVGILNGVDLDEWNPSKDKYLPARYDVSSFKEGKAQCKRALQEELNLNVDPSTPLLGVVSRFDPQKGLDFIAEVAGYFIERYNAQFVLLGSGDHELADRFRALAWRYGKNLAVRDVFSVELSHRIEAASDIFLMPSRYEPCGLNQMYSLIYGTLPLVHDVGGLHDTVVNASNENIANGVANGFIFYWANADDMRKALEWALHCYFDRKEDWERMVRVAMSSDHSWERSAKQYDELYQKLLSK